MRQANEKFETAEDFENIIKHMRNPVELERDCFLENYFDYQKEIIEELS